MVTTTRRMLEELRRPELFDAVLEEVTRVRAEMGYPILVTPVSQFVASQAARNVIDRRALGERLRRDRSATSSATTAIRRRRSTPTSPTGSWSCPRRRSCATWSRSASTARASGSAGAISEEELLLRLTMPEEQVDAMVAARDAARPAPPPAARPGRSPLVTLLSELARRPAITEFALDPRRAATRWCGAVPDGLDRLAIDEVRGFVFDVDGTLAHRGPDGRARPQPGAVEVLERIRASGGRSCCSRTAATSARRRWPARSGRTACRSPTTRC